jgi:hypothetical protein
MDWGVARAIAVAKIVFFITLYDSALPLKSNPLIRIEHKT